MANVTLGGFRFWGTMHGGPGASTNTFTSEIANSYSTALFTGDVLIGISDGTIGAAAAANNGLLLGVAIGFSYVQTGRRIFSPTVPASTTFSPTTVGSANASYCEWIPLTGDNIFEVDANATTTNIATAIGYVGENADLATGTGDATTGVSAMSLDISTHATTTANFRIVAIAGYTVQGLYLGLNDPTASRFKYLVVCNEGLLPPYTATGV